MKINDRKLIQAVQQHQELYTASHPKYGDLEHKRKVWDKIGALLSQHGSTCKIRWNNIRDNFRKSLRKRQNEKEYFLSNKTNPHRRYKYEDLLKFLAPAYQCTPQNNDEINTYLTKVGIEKQEDETNIAIEDDSIQDMETTTSYEGDETLSAQLEVLETQFLGDAAAEESDEEDQPIVPRFPKGRDDELIRNFSRTSCKMIEHFISEENRRQSPHPVDAFLNGLAPTLKAFTPFYQNLIKTKIFAVVQQTELEMISTDGEMTVKDEIQTVEEGTDSPGRSSIEQDQDQQEATATRNTLD